MFHKRLIAGLFLLTCFVLAGCTKDNANDASDFTTEIINTGNSQTITITGYIGASKDVRIPAKIDNIPVTVIGDFAFNNDQLTSVTIPNSVTHIGQLAFNDNPLTSATIPKSVTNIGEMAFFGNQLKSITIPNSVTDIGNYAFANNLLTSVTISNSMTDIGDFAFANNLLTSVIIPNGVTNIGDSAFQENQLANVTIPNSVTHIGEDAFIGNQLISIVIPNSVTYIGGGAFYENQLTSVTISNNVTYIGEYAFSHNKLTSVTIPNSVTHIGEAAFSSNQLTSITIPNSVTYIGEYAFYNNNIATVNILNNMTIIEDEAFSENPLTNVIIGGVTYMENGVIKSQTSDIIILDGKNRNIDDIVLDIVLDRNIYHSKSISIRDVYYNFGTRSDAISFYGADSWFDDPETYGFYQTQTMRSHNLMFWFHPVSSDREGRRYMLEMNGNLYTNPQKVNINGKFYVVTIPGTVVLAFVVESFEISGRIYEGVLPSRILDPAY